MVSSSGELSAEPDIFEKLDDLAGAAQVFGNLGIFYHRRASAIWLWSISRGVWKFRGAGLIERVRLRCRPA